MYTIIHSYAVLMLYITISYTHKICPEIPYSVWIYLSTINCSMSTLITYNMFDMYNGCGIVAMHIQAQVTGQYTKSRRSSY